MAAKSTLLCRLGARPHHRTDAHASCVEWAAEQDIDALDMLAYVDEVIGLEKARGCHDSCLIDTAGHGSRMASCVVRASKLSLRPSGRSKTMVMIATPTWRNANFSAYKNLKSPQSSTVFWSVKEPVQKSSLKRLYRLEGIANPGIAGSDFEPDGF